MRPTKNTVMLIRSTAACTKHMDLMDLCDAYLDMEAENAALKSKLERRSKMMGWQDEIIVEKVEPFRDEEREQMKSELLEARARIAELEAQQKRAARERQEDERDIAAERGWQERQGEEYGSY